MFDMLLPFFVPAIICALLVVSANIGLRLGRRADRRDRAINPSTADEPTHPKFNVIESAMLALLGLLIGYSFSGAIDRYAQRQDLIVNEANAIGTGFLRADLLPRQERDIVRTGLREYVDLRIQLFERIDQGESAALLQRMHAIQSQIWNAAINGLRPAFIHEADRLAPLQAEYAEAVLDPLNETFDLLELRNSAVRRHIPALVVLVLSASAMASVGAVYYGLSEANKRVRGYAAVLTALIGASLWVTFDLDYPRAGLIRADDQPLLDLKAAVSKE
jgi:hypothetical protein